MKYYELSQEEQKLLEDFENDELKSTGSEQRKKLLQKYAKNTLNKSRNINIRLSERDLRRLKTKAMEEGIPYQTLAASILHKSTKQ